MLLKRDHTLYSLIARSGLLGLISSVWKMEATGSFDTCVPLYKTKSCHVLIQTSKRASNITKSLFVLRILRNPHSHICGKAAESLNGKVRSMRWTKTLYFIRVKREVHKSACILTLHYLLTYESEPFLRSCQLCSHPRTSKLTLH
jgi:hypothetical protein